MFSWCKQVIFIENRENMILFDEELVATVCTVNHIAPWKSCCQHPADLSQYHDLLRLFAPKCLVSISMLLAAAPQV
jgi:hypothetical protein